MDPLTRKRKASQSTPVQHLHPDDIPTDVLHDQSPPAPPQPSSSSDTLYDPDARKPKRPRLSISPRRRDSPSRKRSSPPRPRPSPPTQTPWAHYYLHLQRRASHSHTLLSPLAESPVTPVHLAYSQRLYVPLILPPITRETLRELDLEAILKNPQLRHDLLFDPGLQFRPTAGRRKQLAADRYWIALAHELERGCTCAAWDVSGAMAQCGCAPTSASEALQDDARWRDLPEKARRTRPPTPPPWSDRYAAYLEAAADPRLDDARLQSSENRKETEEEHIRVPSRVGPMLCELMAVLRCVIVPPPPPVPHTSSRPAVPPPSSDAQALLAHLDSALMEQELRRGIFDPAGLFGLIGETLKRHCAPMRDRLVDSMIEIARNTEEPAIRRTVQTIRMCFEILELMKLDIANHQLQHLRPFLAVSTPDFELRVFVERCRRGLDSPRVTREWLQRAWKHIKAMPTPAGVLADRNAPQSEAPLSGMDAEATPPSIPRACALALPRRTLIQLSLIHAVTELVFNPPSPSPSASSSTDPVYPETLYLDTARVALLAADAADLTALYMLIMLWRQLVYWNPAGGQADATGDGKAFPQYTRTTARLEDWEVDRVKREVWEVGPRRIGNCFFFADAAEGRRTDASEEDRCRWMHAMQNVALQIAMRAEEARIRTSSEPGIAESTTTRRPPSQEALRLMNGWIHSHMRRDSALASRLRSLLRQEVAETVTRLTFATAGDVGSKVLPAPGPQSSGPGSGGGTAGLEPLMPEIRHLAQRLAKLVLVNLRVYWSLYEVQDFLVDEVASDKS